MSTVAVKVLEAFARELNEKIALHVDGEPEDQLRNPIEILVKSLSEFILPDGKINLKGESRVAGIGRPDFAVTNDQLLVGYIELKAPGKGVDPSSFKSHDKRQFDNFKRLPNLVYSDGNEWKLFQNGIEVSSVRLSSNPNKLPETFPTLLASELQALLSKFLHWEPIVPKSPSDLARYIAPLCRLLKEEVINAMSNADSAFHTLHREWRRVLFPNQEGEEFADAYSQTLTYALLLARVEGADALNLRSAKDKLGERHAVLESALNLTTQDSALKELGVAVATLQRVIQAVDRAQFATKGVDTWLYFYEDFLKEYDPELRKKFGVYYTPREVVNFQVRIVEDILRSPKFGKQDGFADPSVITLDPAAGTGTYLLGVFRNAITAAKKRYGAGMTAQLAQRLAQNLHGFEMLVGPYSVASLRLSEAIIDAGAALPEDGVHLYLCDTLESPNSISSENLFVRALSDEHERARKIKSQSTPVVVCIGNPPYLRHESFVSTKKNYAVTGGWVRHGEYQRENPETPILESFLAPVRNANKGGQLKNLYNLYVYFWRFAIWKVFEKNDEQGGIISFITASSYLRGDAFMGMRKMLREHCDALYIIDLGGDDRGARTEENVFAIQTPVAILVAVRYGKSKPSALASVDYCKVEGTRAQKLAQLDAIHLLDQVEFLRLDTPHPTSNWLPKTGNQFDSWPLLIDLMPWQHSGAQYKRLWPIACSSQVLESRWKMLKSGANLRDLFRVTRDRDPSSIYKSLLDETVEMTPIDKDSIGTIPVTSRYGYRSFDRQWCFADSRFGDFIRPVLWQTLSDSQLFLATLTSTSVGNGPSITCFANVPDLHCLRGSFGAKDILPLFRDSSETLPNLTNKVMAILSKEYGRGITPEELVAYFVGIAGTNAYAELHLEELRNSSVRIPITRDSELFDSVVELGKQLIWLQTYGERFVPIGNRRGEIPTGTAKCQVSVSQGKDKYPNEFSYDAKTQVLKVGDGEFGPVSPGVWNFEVSGLHVVSSWLGYRMRERRGKTSSELDKIYPDTWDLELTKELLELLWVLEHTLDLYPEGARLLREVLSSSLFLASDFPTPSEAERAAPNIKNQQSLF